MSDNPVKLKKVIIGNYIEVIRPPHKIKKSEYLSSGRIPIIDQGANFIGGYIADEERAYNGPLPVVIFGDHTCVYKFVNFPFAVGADGTQIIRPTKEFDIRYFYYCLRTVPLEQFGYQRHFKYLKNHKIIWRPLPLQKKISAILSAYDDLIENNLRRIQILEEMAQLIYREWFVNFRFPGHEKARFVNSELGKIPEGRKKPFKDFVDFKEGPGLRSYQYKEKGIPFLNIRTLVNNDIDFSKVQYLDEEEVNKRYKHFLLKAGDHVVSSSGTLGRIVTIQDFHLPLMLNTSIIRMRAKTNNVGKWQLKHFLKSDYFQNQILSLASGVAQMNYGPSHLKEMFIIAPNQEIGERYEIIVSPLELTINNLVKKNKVLRETRDLLLPKLISGEIDISDLEVVVRTANGGNNEKF